MVQAAFWGFVGGGALLVGAAIGLVVRVPLRVVGLVMGFGVGVLISAVAFELTGAAYDRAGTLPVVLGLSAGALTFYAGDWMLDHRGAENRKDPGGTDAGAGSSAASALVLGALLDGIPESAAIGVSLLGGGSVGIAVVVAVFLSNIPESLSATAGMRRDGRSVGYVLGLWTLVVVASTIAAALGYGLLGGAGETTLAFTETFAAGAVLTMLADTMVPEAVEHAGPAVGLACVTGFICAFILSMAGGDEPHADAGSPLGWTAPSMSAPGEGRQHGLSCGWGMGCAERSWLCALGPGSDPRRAVFRKSTGQRGRDAMAMTRQKASELTMNGLCKGRPKDADDTVFVDGRGAVT